MKCQVLLFFCSNPDALGIDESEMGIYDALKKIAELPPSPSRGGDWLVDSTVGTVESQALGEADGKSPAACTGRCLGAVDFFFCRVLTD